MRLKPLSLLGCSLLLMQTSCGLFESKSHFTPQQLDVIAKLESGLNSASPTKYQFKQTGSFGDGNGTLYYRPGEIKLIYSNPLGDKAIGTQQQLVFYSERSGAVSKWSLKHSPLKAVLKQPIKIQSSGNKITEVVQTDAGTHMLIESRKLLGLMSMDLDYKETDNKVALESLTVRMIGKMLSLSLSDPQDASIADFSNNQQ